jgi:RNA polymerase sigma-70 factor (ECF subfamily)
MKRITINNCINHINRKKFLWTEVTDQEYYPEQQDQQTHDSVQYTVESIHNAMHQLSDGYRTVFSLYMLEGYDHEEIASILNISESTSKSQLSRAKDRIRELITQKSQ